MGAKRGSGYNYVTFFADGKYLGKMPDRGMDMGQDGEIRFNPLFWGTYTVSGGKIRIAFPVSLPYRKEPQVEEKSVCQNGAFIDCSGPAWLRSQLLESADGMTMQGTFRRSDYQAQYSPRQGITFTADGRFADEAF